MKRSKLKSMAMRLKLVGAALLCGLLPWAAVAEDIDIYGPTATGAAPNMLFFLDNTSNWASNNQGWNSTSSWASCLGKNLLLPANAGCVELQTLIKEVYYAGTTHCSLLGLPLGCKRYPWELLYSSKGGSSDQVDLPQGMVQVRTLKYVLKNLVCSGDAEKALKIRAGIAMFGSTSVGTGTVSSGSDTTAYIRHHVQTLVGKYDDASTSCYAIIKKLDDIDAKITDPGYSAGSSGDYGSAMFEMFKYYGGHTNPSKVASDGTSTAGAPIGAKGYGTVPHSLAPSKVATFEDAKAFTSGRAGYVSPIGDGEACGKSFIVMVGNTYPNAEPKPAAGHPARFQNINYTPKVLAADETRFADEWSQFLANTDVSPVGGIQPVFTYAIDTFNKFPDANQSKLMRSMAENGGVGSAGYISVGGDLLRLRDAFSDAIRNAAAVNSVFTATTLPVSTTTQGSYLNQLFVGMFRPDEKFKPRWVGNLKQYRLGLNESTGDIQLVDSVGDPAVLQGTGFFAPDTISYWTHNSVFFQNMQAGTPKTASDSPDGAIVEKGGVAQMLREANLETTKGRIVYTMTGGALDTKTFAQDSTAAPGGLSAAEVNWVRGENNVPDKDAAGLAHPGKDPNGSHEVAGVVTSLGANAARVSMHGDVLHSRPVALNYGEGKVIVFYGSNDGFLRAVDGRQPGKEPTTEGKELWSFIAPEHYGMLKRLRDNQVNLWLPSTNSAGKEASKFEDGDQKKDYAMDGPIGVFAAYSAGTAPVVKEAIIYPTMRRGGRAVYALDVSPAADGSVVPSLKWHIDQFSTGFGKLGQTWSLPRPVIFPSKYFKDPIIFMGGGYDPLEDTDAVAAPTMGNRIYVINGRTGAKLAEFETIGSVPGDVVVADTSGDRIPDRGYVVDVRGNLYRLNMTKADRSELEVDPTKWTLIKIGEVGGKVFGTPDVVVTKNFISVMVGTGDREKPLMNVTADNFVHVKDVPLSASDSPADYAVRKLSNMARIARVDDKGDVVAVPKPDGAPDDLTYKANLARGCYIQLSKSGEKVVNSAFTVAGQTYFGTNRPKKEGEASCTANLGEAKAYAFPLFCEVPTSVVLDGGGMPPSPVGGLVNITDSKGNTVLVPFVIGSGAGKSPLEAERPKPKIPFVRTRNFWKIENGNR